MNKLPIEIIEKILIYLDYFVVIRVCKKWKDIAVNIKHKFKSIHIDLMTDISDKYLKFNPEILNINCSQYYDMKQTIENRSNKFLSEKYWLSAKDLYYEKEFKIIKNILMNIDKLKVLKSLKEINIDLDIVYFINDYISINLIHYNLYNNYFSENKDTYFTENINYFVFRRSYDKVINLSFVVFVLINLLKIKTKKIYIKLHNRKNNLKYIHHECFIKKFLMKHIFNYDNFIFIGNYDLYFFYDNESKSLIYRHYDIHKINKYYIKSDYEDFIYFYKQYKLLINKLYIYNKFLHKGIFKISDKKINYFYILNKDIMMKLILINNSPNNSTKDSYYFILDKSDKEIYKIILLDDTQETIKEYSNTKYSLPDYTIPDYNTFGYKLNILYS